MERDEGLPTPRHAVPEELAGTVRGRPRTRAQNVRLGVYLVTGTIAAGAIVLAVLTAQGRMPWDDQYYTDWGLVALILGAGPFGFIHLSDLNRNRAIDDKFPEFLRDLAESARGGMTLPKALATAARGSYGALTPEIQRMAAQVEWGIGFTEVLERFARRAPSPLVRRTVNLIIEARRAGGSIVDILTAASEDAREIKQIVEQRQGQMASYSTVVYVTFIVFVLVVLVLQYQLVPAFSRAAAASGGNVQFGGVSFSEVDSEAFNTLFFHAALVQAIGGGLVGGVLTKGTPVAGLRSIVVMVLGAWVGFRLLVPLVSPFFGGS